jgi:hypothetical protein
MDKVLYFIETGLKPTQNSQFYIVDILFVFSFSICLIFDEIMTETVLYTRLNMDTYSTVLTVLLIYVLSWWVH